MGKEKLPFSLQNFKFEINPVFNLNESDLKQNLETGECSLVKSNCKRAVYRIQCYDRTYYLKHDTPDCFANKVKSFFRNKCHLEYKAGMELSRGGVGVVPFVCWGAMGLESVLVTEEVPGIEEYKDQWNIVKDDVLQRKKFLQGFGHFLHEIYQSGVRHPDFHHGNILVQFFNDEYKFLLVDVFGIKVTGKATPLTKRAMDYHALAFFSMQMTNREYRGLLRNLFPGLSTSRALSMVQRQCSNYMAHTWDGRKERFNRDSDYCDKVEDNVGRWLLFKGFALETAQKVLRQHLENKDYVKKSVKRRISQEEVNGISYMVKSFSRRWIYRKLCADYQSWNSAFRYMLHGIPVVTYHAWLLSKHNDRGYIIMEFLGEKTLQHILKENRCELVEKRRLLKDSGRLIAKLHNSGIEHGDLKSSNIMVTSIDTPGICLTLIDVDKIKFYKKMPVKRKIKSFLQLLSHISEYVSKSDLLRIIIAYRHDADMSKEQIKQDLLPAIFQG